MTNYETNDSELLENLEYIFTRYYMHSDMFSMFKSLATHWCFIRWEEFSTLLMTRSNLTPEFLTQ